MFQTIDYDNWDRKQIFELYDGMTYSINKNMDITRLYQYMKSEKKKFYPLICWCITAAINSDPCYRITRQDGVLGYFDPMNTSYTLRRKSRPTYFTHMVTEYLPDRDAYYQNFIEDQKKAEAEDRLHYYNGVLQDSIEISITPETSFQSISWNIPARFYQKNENSMRYMPFTVVGKYYKENNRVLLPVSVNFHHAVNDGYHAEKYFKTMQEILDTSFDSGNSTAPAEEKM